MTDRAARSIPEVGSAERDHDEERALRRGRELLHEYGGDIRDALHLLEEELRDDFRHTRTTEMRVYDAVNYEREYSRGLVRHVEQCWATAILR